MKKVLFVLLSVLSVNSLATGFICTEDMRDVDGAFKELQLVDTGSGHDLVFRTMADLDPVVSEKKLATGLSCNLAKDARIAYCFKPGATASDANSLLVSKRVEVTQIRAREVNGAVTKQTYLYVDVRSPAVENSKNEYRFLFSSCKAE